MTDLSFWSLTAVPSGWWWHNLLGMTSRAVESLNYVNLRESKWNSHVHTLVSTLQLYLFLLLFLLVSTLFLLVNYFAFAKQNSSVKPSVISNSLICMYSVSFEKWHLQKFLIHTNGVCYQSTTNDFDIALTNMKLLRFLRNLSISPIIYISC